MDETVQPLCRQRGRDIICACGADRAAHVLQHLQPVSVQNQHHILFWSDAFGKQMSVLSPGGQY